MDLPLSHENQYTPIHHAVPMVDVLRVFLEVSTENVYCQGLNRPLLTPRQVAKKGKHKKSVKLIDSYVKKGIKKITEKEYGHVFDCC